MPQASLGCLPVSCVLSRCKKSCGTCAYAQWCCHDSSSHSEAFVAQDMQCHDKDWFAGSLHRQKEADNMGHVFASAWVAVRMNHAMNQGRCGASARACKAASTADSVYCWCSLQHKACTTFLPTRRFQSSLSPLALDALVLFWLSRKQGDWLIMHHF